MRRFIKSEKGYTSLNLILGILVIGVLSVIAVVLVNPGELTLQRKDVTRKKEVTRVGEALISYAKSKNGTIPPSTKSWLSDLVARGEIPEVPTNIPYENSAALCKKNQQSGICYDTDGKLPANAGIVYAKLESVSENVKCDVALSETAWAVYDMLSIRGGIVCTAGIEPSFSPEGQKFKD